MQLDLDQAPPPPLLLLLLLILTASIPHASRAASFDYADALDKSILFYEQQRSGELPEDQRATWRGDSALTDGQDVNVVDLVGGYYDAGNNVKFGFPGAFTTTMLAWSVIETGLELDSLGELGYAKEAVRWGADYISKTYSAPDVLWAQVGDAQADHACWERPEDMDTPRTAYRIDAAHPGSDLAGESAAALAASSIVFQITDPGYSSELLAKAQDIFRFADAYRGKYSDSLGEVVTPYYNSFSGYEDELLWAAAWLYKASRDEQYLSYLIENGAGFGGTTGTYYTATWDNKLAGVQVLASQVIWKLSLQSIARYKTQADNFVCSVLPGNPKSTATITPGGLLYVQEASNMQYVTSAAFLFFTYAKYLEDASQTVSCGDVQVSPDELNAFAKQQVDYILGNNPRNSSYMIGFGRNFPQRVHHRASSMPSIEDHPAKIGCQEGFQYLQASSPNPNPIVGGVVGGPDSSDQYSDDREAFTQSEPSTYINAGLVGALATLAGQTL
ncbi:hypothetical protein SELMODRAFT_131698 [Selaginella moellendorffii]|uniref:Endoglucanase n=1 Tax=Selaginella moellendorffii TaxID=88036 RepID=D8T4H6_SELML|nr:hypothetical protein SELMODRAFT_131698 [Selaginella moellendorffii]